MIYISILQYLGRMVPTSVIKVTCRQNKAAHYGEVVRILFPSKEFYVQSYT